MLVAVVAAMLLAPATATISPIVVADGPTADATALGTDEARRDDQMDLVRHVLQVLDNDGEGRASQQAMFQAARLAVDHRQTLVGGLLPEAAGPALAQLHSNLDSAEDLLAIADTDHEDDLERAVALAKESTRWQAETLGLHWTNTVPLHAHRSPSEALGELAERQGVSPSAEERARMKSLDVLPEDLQDALVRFVDAFLALDTATHLAYQNADTARLESLAGEHGRLWAQQGPLVEQYMTLSLSLDMNPEESLAHLEDDGWWPEIAPVADLLGEAGVDFTPVFPIRNQLLDAVLGLDQALTLHPTAASASCDSLQLPPVFSIDLGQCDNVYAQDFALVLDAGGNDVYNNNAGGSNLGGPDNCPAELSEAGTYSAAALVDLGTGSDRFGDPQAPRGCGANGGGSVGVGFLLTGGGDNEYHADAHGTNGGGGLAAAGFLLDASGNDTFNAAGDGTNGGGSLGVGTLINGGGHNEYNAGNWGTNGGGSIGVGTLIDGGWGSKFDAGLEGTNGGGFFGGTGLLFHGLGGGTYNASDFGTNGGGGLGGSGFLLSGDRDSTYNSAEYGTNGGAGIGVGFLMDLGGDTDYRSIAISTNGGSGNGAGFLLDGGGDDTFTTGTAATNGGGAVGAGFLLDAAGNDTYIAPGSVTNGAAVGLGLLLDAGGTDYYEDPAIPGGFCLDCTVVPKGPLGMHVDSDDISLNLPICILHPTILITEEVGTQGFVLDQEDPTTGRPLYRPGSGVTSGSGTAEDPYVIEDWCIPGGAATGTPRIGIQGTDSHVVIRNNTLAHAEGVNQQWLDHGVLLDSAHNVTMEDNRIGNVFHSGVAVLGSSNTEIRGNTIDGLGSGIFLDGSQETVIRANTIETFPNRGPSIRILDSEGTAIHDNDLSGGTDVALQAVGVETPILATNNWWGHDSGPGGGVEDACTGAVAEGDGYGIELEDASICFDPWRSQPNAEAGA